MSAHQRMDLFMRFGLAIAAFLVLTACQIARPDDGADAPGAIAGGPIEVTSLDDPAAEPVVGLAEEQATENPVAAVPGAPAVAQSVPEEPAVEPPVVAEPDVVDPALLTPEAVACTRKGGRWSKIGSGETRACVKVTRDGGDQCRRDSDCEGVCLARSTSCAPVAPLFGCNEVLQDDGRRMTLCLD